MIKKRLLNMVPESKRYIALNVLFQWVSLIANIVMMTAITGLLASLFLSTYSSDQIGKTAVICVVVLLVRAACSICSSRMSYLSSKTVKKVIREQIYKKLLSLGTGYKEKVQTSEVVQVAVEGVEQLETYFGAYMPQFFYAMLAPITLFIVLCFVNVPSAVVLLICVPLIPIAIAVVQTWAKKLLAKYWGQYTALGDTFLENLQGLTTLKIYQSDAYKNEQMNQEAEKFRKITMKVLTMQLNSITIMDFIAYGGAALGMILAVTQFQAGHVDLRGCLLIILLSADFFIPMRQLGSFFHIAMNGMAASDKIFALLDLPEPEKAKKDCPKEGDIVCENVNFSYDEDRQILNNISLTIAKKGLTAIAGESGCGKSTIASILMGRSKNYKGSIKIGGTELSELSEESLMKHITYVSHQSYLFKGTVRENLLMGDPKATDDKLWEVLERVNLAAFLKTENGLDTTVLEKGSNFSGGQCQRLALARALLHDSPVYIFDEATSNIDVESENDIIAEMIRMAQTKSVLVISHRLANITKAQQIYVMEAGVIRESGTQDELLAKKGVYEKLWKAQQSLEQYTKAEVNLAMDSEIKFKAKSEAKVEANPEVNSEAKSKIKLEKTIESENLGKEKQV